MLRPHIDRGEVTLICEATAEGLGASARAEPSFVAAFRRVDVEPTGPEETEAILAQVALAASPVITELRPRGAEIGRPFTLTLVGRNIPDGARVISTAPASFTLVAPSQKPGLMMAAGRSVSFLVEPKADAQIVAHRSV